MLSFHSLFDFLHVGPLLPEQRDVLHIPVSIVRDITINLSGECFFVFVWNRCVIVVKGG